jgi:hypothetical protein
MTWHQWQVDLVNHYEYPIDKKIGLFSALAVSKASSPQGNQFTGLFLCWSKYGLFSLANLLGTVVVVMGNHHLSNKFIFSIRKCTAYYTTRRNCYQATTKIELLKNRINYHTTYL